MASTSARRVRYMLVACVLVIAVLVAVIVWLAVSKNNTETVRLVPESRALSGYIPPKAIRTHDALTVRWFPNATRVEHIEDAVKGGYNMVDISKLASVAGASDGIKLDTVWETLQTNNIGAKINVNNMDEAEKVIGFLKDRTSDRPVLISVPHLSPGSTIDYNRFVDAMSGTTSKAPLAVNIDITECCNNKALGHGTVEYLGFKIKDSNFSMSVEISVDMIQSSWTQIKWLLDTNPNLQIILSTKPGTTVTKYDLLLVRNDIDSDRVFYNIDAELRRQFLELASTAGSPMVYFGITPRDASRIIWSHNTDTWELLNAATQGDTMMVEGDIMLLGQDTGNQTELPIMAHDVGDNNNLTFEQWLDEIIKVDKGMKLDFKTIDAVKPALEIVSRKRSQIKGPVWANADILNGPNNGVTRIPANDFLDAVKTFPDVVLSLGWKGGSGPITDPAALKYSMAMVEEMYNTVKNLTLPVTFPVNAFLLTRSWTEMRWLMEKSRGYTLTVWHSKLDTITTKAHMDYIQRESETARVYFDLPEDLRPTID